MPIKRLNSNKISLDAVTKVTKNDDDESFTLHVGDKSYQASFKNVFVGAPNTPENRLVVKVSTAGVGLNGLDFYAHSLKPQTSGERLRNRFNM